MVVTAWATQGSGSLTVAGNGARSRARSDPENYFGLCDGVYRALIFSCRRSGKSGESRGARAHDCARPIGPRTPPQLRMVARSGGDVKARSLAVLNVARHGSTTTTAGIGLCLPKVSYIHLTWCVRPRRLRPRPKTPPDYTAVERTSATGLAGCGSETWSRETA